jgi:hypothetical protein
LGCRGSKYPTDLKQPTRSIKVVAIRHAVNRPSESGDTKPCAYSDGPGQRIHNSQLGGQAATELPIERPVVVICGDVTDPGGYSMGMANPADSHDHRNGDKTASQEL